jgi:hypothetical protein
LGLVRIRHGLGIVRDGRRSVSWRMEERLRPCCIETNKRASQQRDADNGRMVITSCSDASCVVCIAPWRERARAKYLRSTSSPVTRKNTRHFGVNRQMEKSRQPHMRCTLQRIIPDPHTATTLPRELANPRHPRDSTASSLLPFSHQPGEHGNASSSSSPRTSKFTARKASSNTSPSPTNNPPPNPNNANTCLAIDSSSYEPIENPPNTPRQRNPTHKNKLPQSLNPSRIKYFPRTTTTTDK